LSKTFSVKVGTSYRRFFGAMVKVSDVKSFYD